MAEGAQKKKKRIWPFVILGAIAYGVWGKSSHQQFSPSMASLTVSSGQTVAMPTEEKAVLQAIVDARATYDAAPNDLAKGGARLQRKRAMCGGLKGRSVEGWVGTISTLSSNSDGKGVLSISIGPDVSIGTWNNAVSDIMHSTLISPGSPLFSKLADLKTGDTVKFSGQFFQSDVDCVFESSVTLDGSMEDPAFLMRFSSITPL